MSDALTKRATLRSVRSVAPTDPNAQSDRLAGLVANPAAVGRVPVDALPALFDAIVQEVSRLDALKLAIAVRLAADSNQPSSESMAPYTLADAARLLVKSRAWVRRHAKLGRLKGARKVGKSWVFVRTEFDRFIRQAHEIS